MAHPFAGAESSRLRDAPVATRLIDTKRVEEELADLLMAVVEVRIKKSIKRSGKREDIGEVAIQFASIDELNGLIERLRGQDAHRQANS